MTEQALRGTLRLKLMSIIIQNMLSQKPIDITIDTTTLKPVGQYDSTGYCPEAVDIGAGYMRRLQSILGAQSARKVFPIYMSIFDTLKQTLNTLDTTHTDVCFHIAMPTREVLATALKSSAKALPVIVQISMV